MIILLNNIRECFLKISKRSEFGKISIVVFVAYDVDAICALRILSELFKNENLLYKVFPVGGFQEMEEAINQSREIDTAKSFVFINCAGVYRMSDFWFAEKDSPIKTFIFDNHQPIEEGNANSENKIYIIDDGMSDLRLCPTNEDRMRYEQLNEEDSDDDGIGKQFQKEEVEDPEDYEEDDENPQNDAEIDFAYVRKRRRYLKEKKIQKKIKLQEVKRIQEKITHYYESGHYYCRPTSTVIYCLAQQLSSANNDMLWYALLGLTDCYLSCKLNHSNYEKLFQEFASEIIRLNPQHIEQVRDVNAPDRDIENTNKRNGEIFMENEYNKSLYPSYKFLLLRQQSLYDSMLYSNYMGSRLNLWNNRDNNVLEDIIAKVGIPLEEAKQLYRYMNHKYKLLLREKMSEVGKRFQLEDILYRSFVRQIDSTMQVTAADMSQCLSTILEYPPKLLGQILDIQKNKSTQQGATERSQNFWIAFDTLDTRSHELIAKGFELSIESQKALVNEAKYLLERKEVFPSKHFRYSFLKNETIIEKKYFQHPQSIQKLALLLMEIYRGQNKKQETKPIVLCQQSLNADTYLVVGVVGAQSFGQTDKNQFGSNFMKVVYDRGFRFKQDNFETSIIEISKIDFMPFLDALLEQN